MSCAKSLYIDKSSAVPSLKTPTGLAAVSVENSVMVSWEAVANAESYEVTCAGQTKNVTETKATFTDVAVGTYEVSVVAKGTGYKNSAAAVTSVIVGKPTTLDKPVIKTVREIANGFYAELESEVQYAKSYDWELYEGSVAEENLVGCGENSTVKFSITINETDFDITAFKPETTYYLVITAKAPAYTSSESEPASFTTAGSTTDWSKTYTSNVKISGAKVKINNVEYDAIQVGSSKSSGRKTFKVPANTTKLYLHVVGWNGEDNKTHTIKTSVGTISSSSIKTTADSGAINQSPFTLSSNDYSSSKYFYEFTLSGVTSEATITISNSAKNSRGVYFGINAE